jgi:hypothetical protein
MTRREAMLSDRQVTSSLIMASARHLSQAAASIAVAWPWRRKRGTTW